MLRDEDDVAALSRLDRDRFSVPNLGTVVALLGVNDLGHAEAEGTPMPDAPALISAYRAPVERAHARGVRVVASAIMPFKGAGPGYYSDRGERVRQAVDRWIRGGGVFDTAVDLDRLTANSTDPARLDRSFDSGDSLHSGDAGFAKIAAAFDLTALRAGHPARDELRSTVTAEAEVVCPDRWRPAVDQVGEDARRAARHRPA